MNTPTPTRHGAVATQLASLAIDADAAARRTARLDALLSPLIKHKFAWVFSSPVDTVALGLHDDDTVVTTRMDLGTVGRKLRRGAYGAPDGAEVFARDVRLTFENAIAFERTQKHYEHSDVNQLATEMLRDFNAASGTAVEDGELR